MTTAELLAVLAQECRNGVSFDPMAVRLLRQKVALEDWQIENLKAEMFQLRNGLWFSPEMIFPDDSLLAFSKQATAWLSAYGCFSVEALFNKISCASPNVTTPEDRAAFLKYLRFTVAEWKKGGFFCLQPPPTIEDILTQLSKIVLQCLEDAGGTLPLDEIEQLIPNLTAEALESVRAQFLPDVHKAEIGGILCWCDADTVPLPEDFAEKLTSAVDALFALDERVSPAKLEFALNLFYRSRIRQQYGLLDNGAFMRVCEKHYKGVHDIFSKTRQPELGSDNLSEPVRRVRSPNTRFHNLGVPIGGELVFTKDDKITCTVLDDYNQVEYGNKTWSISALAIHLLGVSSVNGFCHFSYQGEILWDRRLRLERVDKPDVYQAA